MADPALLKASVETHLARLQRDRAKAAATHEAELARMDAQIAATQQVLAVWDQRVDGLIDRLTAAGIQIGGVS